MASFHLLENHPRAKKYTKVTVCTVLLLTVLYIGVIAISVFCTQSMDTNLPVMIVTFPDNTDFQSVNEDTLAEIRLIDNNNKHNIHIPSQFDSTLITRTLRAKLHIRGTASRAYPKKQYAVSFVDEKGEDEEVKLFGLPKQSKFAFYNSGLDISLIRNRLSFEISRALGNWAPNTAFFELFITNNGENPAYPTSYRGVYLLEERITRDNLELEKVKPDSTPEETSFVMKADNSLHPSPEDVLFPVSNVLIYVDYPKRTDVTQDRIDYIQKQFATLDNALSSPDFAFNGTAYTDVINPVSFMDTFIVQELSKNQDAYRRSAYYYKDAKGLLNSGPMWDMDRTYGNVNDPTLTHVKAPEGWLYDIDWTPHTPTPSWWVKLFNDPSFSNQLADRWEEMRQPGEALHIDSLYKMIEDDADTLTAGGAANRNSLFWGPCYNMFLFRSSRLFSNDVAEMKTWIAARLQWMDQNIQLL